MADGESEGHPIAIAGALFAFLFVVSIGWFMFGGWREADLRSYFLAPPSAPQVIIPEYGESVIQGSTTTPATYPSATTAPQL